MYLSPVSPSKYLHIQWIYSLNSLNTSTTRREIFNSSHMTIIMSCVKKWNSLTVDRGSLEKQCDTIRFIHNEINLMSDMSPKSPQSVHRKHFWPILMICIHKMWCQKWCQYVWTSLCLIILWISSIVQVFGIFWQFDTFRHFDTLLPRHRVIFLNVLWISKIDSWLKTREYRVFKRNIWPKFRLCLQYGCW